MHSSDQHPTVGIPINETAVNSGLNQVIISEVNHSKADHIIKKGQHGNKERRLVQFNKNNSEQVPYHPYFENDEDGKLYEKFSRILQAFSRF